MSIYLLAIAGRCTREIPTHTTCNGFDGPLTFVVFPKWLELDGQYARFNGRRKGRKGNGRITRRSAVPARVTMLVVGRRRRSIDAWRR
jgi:hypothetical protein